MALVFLLVHTTCDSIFGKLWVWTFLFIHNDIHNKMWCQGIKCQYIFPFGHDKMRSKMALSEHSCNVHNKIQWLLESKNLDIDFRTQLHWNLMSILFFSFVVTDSHRSCLDNLFIMVNLCRMSQTESNAFNRMQNKQTNKQTKNKQTIKQTNIFNLKLI